MNPSTYKRKKFQPPSPAAPGLSFGSAASFFKEVLQAPVHSAIALAFVIFAAGSLIGVAGAANAELSTLDFVGDAQTLPAGTLAYGSELLQPQVLGETSYRAVPVTSPDNRSMKIVATPVSYSEDGWVYKITWKRALKRTGSLYINGSVLAEEAAQSGEKEVTLPAATKVKVEFYSSAKKGGTVIVRRYFMTLPAQKQEEADEQQDIEDSTGATLSCSQEAKICPDNKTYVGRSGPKCEFVKCPVPVNTKEKERKPTSTPTADTQ